MRSYIHKGIVKANGIVDTAQSITEPSKLRVLPSDNGFQLKTSEIGNFEWWYFDIIDFQNDCLLKIVAHLGTDPLRRRFFPQLAISIKTPIKKQYLVKLYSFKDFHASSEFCDVKLKDEFHAFIEDSVKENRYHLSVNTDEFKAEFTFISEIEGWKPLGDNIKIEKKRKKGTFFWVLPMPKAKVVGEFTYGHKKYKLKEALGYHDHNYWMVDFNKKLFMDDVISKWYWGKIFAEDYLIIFMDIYIMSHSIRSFMLAKDNKIIQSSNNFIEVCPNDFIKDDILKTSYPSRIMINSIEQNNPFRIILNSKEIIDRKDLLEGVNPVIKWLVKCLIARPAYWGIYADATIRIRNEEIKGKGIYELMVFKNK